MRTLLAALVLAAPALLLPAAARAQPSGPHINALSVTRILGESERNSERRAARIPDDLPRTLLFRGRAWWAVLQMCAEHRAGAGRPPGTPAPVLDEAGEKDRRFFMLRAAAQFARDSGMTPEQALYPVRGWGSEFARGMNAAAASGAWSSDEFEETCRILGPAHLRFIR